MGLKIALFNVTDLIDKNPGCQATIAGLRFLLKNHHVVEYPLGYLYKHFTNKKKYIPQAFYYHKFLKNSSILNDINAVDVVIINAEGTIHSSNVGALTLLSIAKISKKTGKQVYIVNGTFYHLNAYCLKILKHVDKIFVREILSKNYLLSQNIPSDLVYDCAFLNEINIDKTEVNTGSCLYTPGVNFSHHSAFYSLDLEKILTSHYNTLSTKFNQIDFLMIEDKEKKLTNIWSKSAADIIFGHQLKLEELFKILSTYDTIISGRYHILIFAMMLGKKIIPLESNTYKIEGLIKTFFNNEEVIVQKLDDNLELHAYQIHINLDDVKNTIFNNYKKLLDK